MIGKIDNSKSEIDFIVSIFENNDSLKSLLISYDLYDFNLTGEPNPERIQKYKNLAELFIENDEEIKENTIKTLFSEEFLISEIESIFETSEIKEDLYSSMFYAYKYGSVKKFFIENWPFFLPDYDSELINSKQKMQLFVKGFMQEFDRFADLIDRIYDFTDIDKVPVYLLNYLSQLVGFEKLEDSFLNNEEFRLLVKNIVEIYRIKGTSYSFELFSNFLGFNITLIEYWFDRRLYYFGRNDYTFTSNKNDFYFYLTPNKPTENLKNNEVVLDSQITKVKSEEYFNYLKNTYTIEEILGVTNSSLSSENVFNFFKTNIISYEITRISDGQPSSEVLTNEEQYILNLYLDFITPITVKISSATSPVKISDELGLSFNDETLNITAEAAGPT